MDFSPIPIFGYWFPGKIPCLAGTWTKMERVIHEKWFTWQIQSSLCSWYVHELIVVSFCWKLFNALAGDFEPFFFTVWADFKIPDVNTGYLEPDDCDLFVLPSFLSFHRKTDLWRSPSQTSIGECMPNSSCLNDKEFAQATILKASQITRKGHHAKG